MAIKAIIFDCFGVLVKYNHTALRDRFPDHIVQLSKLEEDSNRGKISRPKFIGLVSELTGLGEQEVSERYYCADSRGYNKSAIDWAWQIKKSGQYKVGFLSNVGKGWLDVFLADIKGDKLFDAKIISGEINLIKPDPKIFKLMAKKLGLKPEECIMIDDIPANIKGAKDSGMSGIIFEYTTQAQAELAKIIKE